MTTVKKTLAVLLSALTVILCFAGCSKSEVAEEITADTMLIAYTEDNAPFVYEENGELKGFDVELFKTIFDDIKNEYKNYKFVKVDKDYKIGEDVYCTTDDGKECIAYVMIGGIQKDVGAVNESYTLSEPVISNRIITVTADGSEIGTYADLSGRNVGIITDAAKAALDKHTAVKDGFKSLTEYDKAEAAIADVKSGKIDALIIDEFTYNTADSSGLKALDGELDTVDYAYAFKKWDWYVDSINEAIYELKSPDYDDADNFTPMVEKYFGYNASAFNYQPEKN